MKPPNDFLRYRLIELGTGRRFDPVMERFFGGEKRKIEFYVTLFKLDATFLPLLVILYFT